MKKAKLLPLYFEETNEREIGEMHEQLECLRKIYGDVAEFFEPVMVGQEIPKADALVFPKMIFAAFRHDKFFEQLSQPILVLTSQYGTVEMWDWEIVTYLRDLGCTVFSPYNVELGKVIIRAIAVKSSLSNGAKFLMFQDSPGEGMQAYIFKKFYWWEKQSPEKIESIFGCKIIYRSWRELNEQARTITDEEADIISEDWRIACENVSRINFRKAVKIYIAVKRVIDEIGEVAGVGSNCLNESFYSDTTPCLAWNMLFERDDILWACEGDTLTMLSNYILYRSLEKPFMMTNLYPFLVGMAALAHERIKTFPEVRDSDNCALGVHCGYFGFIPRKFCSSWKLCPKVLAIVNDDACMVDARMSEGPVTLAKIYPGFKKLSVIPANLEQYVQYEGSDCLNGALFRYKDGHKVMDALCSHHALVISGDVKVELQQLAKVFDMKAMIIE